MTVRFPASQNTKISFKVYISLLKKKEMLGDAEMSLEQLLLDYNHDIGGKYCNPTKYLLLIMATMTVTLDIISPKHEVVGQLHFKIAAVLDGKMEDMAEAVQATQTQSVVLLTLQNVMADAVQPDTHSDLSSPPLMVQHASQIVEAMDPVVQMGMALPFSDTVSNICTNLKALQNLGDHLSEVSHRC